MSNKHISVGNVPIKADFHIRIQNSSEICCLLIFDTTMNTNSKIILMCGGKETLGHCWWKCELVQPLWETLWRFLEKLKIQLSHDPAILLLGTYPEKTETLSICTSIFTAVAETRRQSMCSSTDEWIRKMWHIYKIEY